MSGNKASNPIKKIFESLTKEKTQYNPVSGLKSSSNIAEGELASLAYQTGLGAKAADQYLKTTNEQTVEAQQAQKYREAIEKQQKEFADQKTKEIGEITQKKETVLSELKKLEKSSPEGKEIESIIGDPKNYTALINPIIPTDLDALNQASLLNPAKGKLSPEAEERVKILKELQKQKTAPLLESLETLKQEGFLKSSELQGTQAYLKMVQERDDLENKYTYNSSLKTKQKLSDATFQEAAEGASTVEKAGLWALSLIKGTQELPEKLYTNVVDLIAPPESNMSKEDKLKYEGLNKQIREIEKPFLEKVIEDLNKQKESSQAVFAKNDSKKTFYDGISEGFAKWPGFNLLSKEEDSHIRSSTIAVERALEEAQNLLEGKGGASIFAEELSKITVGRNGLFEKKTLALNEFLHYDNLVKEEQEKGFENLSPVKQEALKLYTFAKEVENRVAQNQSFSYKTVKGTMESMDFMIDLFIARGAGKGLSGVTGVTSKSLAYSGGARVMRATGSSIAGRTTALGTLGAGFAAETALATYINPKSINARKNKGAEFISDDQGNITDFLTREELYDYKKQLLEEERVRLEGHKTMLENQDNLSEEHALILQQIKARLGESSSEGIPSLDDELSMYETEGDTKANIKGMLDTGIEKVAELYTTKIFKGIGQGSHTALAYISPRGGALVSKGITKFEKFSDNLTGRFYNTGVGRAYKNWQEVVGKANINDTKVIGSVFEEIPEEYVAAIGGAILDWDATELKEMVTSYESVRDIGAQTALMNVMMGTAGNIQLHSKLRYNTLYNNRLNRMNKRLKELEKFAKDNPDDTNGKIGLAEYKKQIADVKAKSSLGILDPTRFVSGDDTGFSNTRKYIDQRKQARAIVDQLRFATEDKDIVKAVDVTSLSFLSAAYKEGEAQILEAQGKKEAAELIRKSMFNDIVFKAFATNTQDELEAGLRMAKNNKKISLEKRTKLEKMYNSVVELRQLKTKYQENGIKPDLINQAVSLSYGIMAAKEEVEETKKLLTANAVPALEVITALAQAKGIDASGYSLDQLGLQEFSDPVEQEQYDNFIEALYETQDKAVIAQLDGVNNIKQFEESINSSVLARVEILNPSAETKNSQAMLEDLTKEAQKLFKKEDSNLTLKNAKYDEEGNLIKSKELIAELFDAMEEKWVGKTIDGKISTVTFETLKKRAIEKQEQTEAVLKMFNGRKTTQTLAAAEAQKASEISPVPENIPSTVAETMPLTDVDSEEIVTGMVPAFQNMDLPEVTPDYTFDPGADVTDFQEDPTDPVVNQDGAIVFDSDDFEDFMLASKVEYTTAQQEQLIAFVTNLASPIALFTGQDVSLSMAFEQAFRVSADREKLVKRLPHFINGWKLAGFKIEKNEELDLYNKFYTALTRISDEPAFFDNFSETIPSVFTQPVGQAQTTTYTSTVEESKKVNAELQPVGESSFIEENTAIPLTQPGVEDTQEGKTNEVKPKVGYSSMAYVTTVLPNGQVVKQTANSLLNVIADHPLGLDFRPLLNPNNGPTITLGVQKVDESKWKDVPTSAGLDSRGLPILDETGKIKLISFADWVEANKNEPNFKEMFDNKVPYVYTYQNTVVGFVHETDWYNPNNVSHPFIKDATLADMDEAWIAHIEEGKKSTALLRQNIIAGLKEVTGNVPESAVYHTLLEDEALIPIREANPQAVMSVQVGVDGKLEGLDPGFQTGDKILVNSETGEGALSSSTSGHTFAVHRVGTIINPTTGKKVETYRAVKVHRYFNKEQYQTLQYAIAIHKYLNGKPLGANSNVDKKVVEDIAEDVRKEIRKTMGLNITNPKDLASYIQHFVKITQGGLTFWNSNRKNYSATDVTDMLAYISILYEQNLPFAEVKKIVEQNTSKRGLMVKNGFVLIDQKGPKKYQTAEGKEGTYHDYLLDTVVTNIKTFDTDTTGQAPLHALGVQPVITIDYTPVIQNENVKTNETQQLAEVATQAAIAEQAQEQAPEFDEQAAIEYLSSLGVDIEDFQEDEDFHLGDPSKIKDLFSVTPGLTISDETPLKEEIAHTIIKKLDFKNKISESSREKIKKEVKEHFVGQLKIKAQTLQTLLDKAKASKTPSDKIKLIEKALETTQSNIKKVINNFESIYAKALNEVNTQIKVDLSENKEFEDTEDSTLMEKNYSKESVEESLKSKASERLRMLFSGIPQLNEKGEPIKGYLGFRKFMSLNDIYNEVLKNISFGVDPESDFKLLIQKLENSSSPAMKEIVLRLKSAEEQIKNEFVYNVVSHTLTSKFAMYEELEKGFSLKMYDTNANEITRVLKTIWKENSVASDLYNYDGSVNVDYAKSLIEEFQSLPKDYTQVSGQTLRNWLSKVGIELNDNTWEELVEGKLFYKGNFVSFNTLYAQKSGGLFPSLVAFLQDAIDPKNAETHFANGSINILSDLGGIGTAIATLEAKYNPQLVSLSFRDTGKNINTQVPPKFVTDKVSELLKDARGSQEKIQALQKLSFTQDSLFLSQLLETPEVREGFGIHHAAITSLKEKGSKSFGKKDITALGEMDYDLVTTTGFSDRRVTKLPDTVKVNGFSMRMANMLFPTMSDKSTALFLTAPVFDFLKEAQDSFSRTDEGKVTGITEDVKDILFQYLVLPEIKRMHKFYKDVKVTNIKGYDKAVGVFHLLPIMNTLKNAEGVPLKDIIKNNAEVAELDVFLDQYGEIFKASLESVIRSEVEDKLNSWESALVDTDGKKTSKMFSTEYFTSKDVNADPEKDYEVAVWDYVMNSMIFNAEVFKVFAGDVALYSQDKLYKNSENFTDAEWINLNKKIGVNLGKRLALLIAPGKKIANSIDEKYNQIILKDSIDITENAEMLIEMYYSKKEAAEARPILKKYATTFSRLQKVEGYSLEGKSSEQIQRHIEIKNKLEETLKSIRQKLSDKYKSIDAYFDIESTDAQEYTTMLEHLNILERLGRISKEDQKAIVSNLDRGEDLTKEQLSLVMQPIKPVHTGSYVNDAFDTNRMVYIKSSSFPLIPQLTRGTKLDHLRRKMEELEVRTGRFTRASYQTANKVGSFNESNAINPFDVNDLERVFNGLDPQTREFKQGEINSSVLVLDRNNFRIQQDVPFKSDKKKRDEVALGTQIFKLLFGDGVKQSTTFNFKGKPLSGDALYEVYNKSFTSIVNAKKEELFRELGLSSEGKILDQEMFVNSLQNVLEKEAIDRGYSIKSIRGLKMEKLVGFATGQPYYDFKTPLWLSPDSNRYESLLNSIITNRIMKHKMPGAGYVAGSESGFSFQENLSGIEDSRIIFLDKWNGKELQGVSVKEQDGAPVFTSAQVFAPSKFKDKNNKLIDLFEGFNSKTGDVSKAKYLKRNENGSLGLKEDMIDPEVLNLFSFRTPTSSHVSGSSIEVVGILPPEAGDLMVVPKNFTKQKGLDYDIDKESAYQLNHVQNPVTGKIEVLSEKHLEQEMNYFNEIIENLDLENTFLNLKGKNYSFGEAISEAKYSKLSIYDLKNTLLERFAGILENSVAGEDIEILLDPTTSVKEKKEAKKLQLEKKLAENDFIRVHLAVYNSPDLEIQKKINKVLSMSFAGDQANYLENLSEEGKSAAFIKKYLADNPEKSRADAKEAYRAKYMNSTILGYSYQKAKMNLGSVGKIAIGIYANYTTYNGLINQTFGEKGMAILNREGGPKAITIGNFTSTSLGAQKSLSPIETGLEKVWREKGYERDSSEVWAEKENTATDNEKEQILGRVGINEDNINVESLTTLRGFDKDENGNSIPYLLMSQPVIQDYIKTLKSSKGILGEFISKESAISAILQDLSNGEISYELNPETFAYEFQNRKGEVISWEGSTKLTGDNLLAGISENGANKAIQLDAFMTYIELQKEASQVSAAQKVTNTNSLGKSIVESMSKQEGLARLVDNPMVPSAINLLGEVSDKPAEGYYPFTYTKNSPEGPKLITKHIKPTTPQGQIAINGLYFGNNLFKDFFPYSEPAIRTIINEIGVSDNENTAIEEIETILEEIKKYVYSNSKLGIFEGDTFEKRKELFVDSANNTSLAKYLMDVKKSNSKEFNKGLKKVKNNPLFSRFIYEVGKGEDRLSTIAYNNSATDNLDEETLYNSMVELVETEYPLPPKNGKPYSTVDLVQDLIAYSFLEGGIQEATQFVKFIPIELLEAMGKTNKNGKFISIARSLQYYNPKQNTNGDIFGNFLGITEENVGGTSTFTTQFFQHYPSKTKKINFKERKNLSNSGKEFNLEPTEYTVPPSFVHVKSKGTLKLYMHVGNYHYSQIDVLSGKGISQYQYKSDNAKSVKGEKLEAPVPQVITPNSSIGELVVTPGKTIKSLINDVSNLELSPEFAHLTYLASWLKDKVKNTGDLMIVPKDKIAGAGATGSQSLYIKLSSELFEKGAKVEKAAEIFVHEFIHHVSIQELSNYYEADFLTLKDSAPAHVVALDNVFKTFSASLDQNTIEEVKRLTTVLFNRDNSYTAEERNLALNQLNNLEERDIYYAAINIKEFIATSLTDKSMQQKLSSIPYETKGKSLLEAIQDFIKELFTQIYPEIKGNTLAMEALQASMNFIQEEYNIRQKNSIPLPEIKSDPVLPRETFEDPSFTIEDPFSGMDMPEPEGIDEILEQRQAEKAGRQVTYTPKGKTKQAYTVKGNQIFNSKGTEVFKAPGVDRNKILANLAVIEGRAVIVEHTMKGETARFVVDEANQIISVTTGKIMQWGENNGDRKDILGKAEVLKGLKEDNALPLNLTKEEWESLTEQEKQRIKDCN
jgi:hypothetical protein